LANHVAEAPDIGTVRLDVEIDAYGDDRRTRQLQDRGENDQQHHEGDGVLGQRLEHLRSPLRQPPPELAQCLGARVERRLKLSRGEGVKG
jgi:hypothetical protein